MKKNALLLFILFSTSCFSQSYIEGFIFDKETNTSLPYATIKIISTNNYYTITNEDGKFEINTKFESDTLEVRTIGFKTKKVPVSYFKNNKKFFLTPNINNLNTVLIVAKKEKNYAYNLLNSLIKKYKNKNLITKSKAFLTHTSSTKGVPIEIIESFYNSEQNLSKGIVNLNLKRGRFGQNSSYPFYSLHNTDILKSFKLFKKSNKTLPLYPGNLSLGAIKWKYNVKIDQCDNCSAQDVSISFIPKNPNGRFLSGHIIFNKETLTIKKIELKISEPKIIGLLSIKENDIVTPKNIKLAITFNPIDYEKIQSLDFEFIMYYKSNENLDIITSNSFLYFYDYGKSFEEPYFTNKIKFNNDYDKIMALKASEVFWNSNYQFPKSFREEKSIDYFKKYGHLINYNTTIPYNYITDIRSSIITWEKGKLLDWRSIKDELKSNKKDNPLYYNSNGSLKTNVVFKSTYDLKKYLAKQKIIEAYNFSYSLDSYFKNGEIQYVTQTLFDTNSSFCKYRTENKLIYIGVIFDIYEVFNQKLKTSLSNKITFEEAKVESDKKFKEATDFINIMKAETASGLNSQKLIRWSKRIKLRLNSAI
jgi:CarboxypepD_reg-like domain